VSECNGCKLKCEFTESRKFASRLRRYAIARRHARSLCAATGTVASPFIDGRKSVASRAHTNMRATTEGPEIPRSGNSLPRRVIALGYSSTACAGSCKHHPVHRWSKIGRVTRRINMLATTEGAEILRSGNSLRRRAIALGYSCRLCAGSRKPG
jgi:hypothetical protein